MLPDFHSIRGRFVLIIPFSSLQNPVLILQQTSIFCLQQINHQECISCLLRLWSFTHLLPILSVFQPQLTDKASLIVSKCDAIKVLHAMCFAFNAVTELRLIANVTSYFQLLKTGFVVLSPTARWESSRDEKFMLRALLRTLTTILFKNLGRLFSLMNTIRGAQSSILQELLAEVLATS